MSDNIKKEMEQEILFSIDNSFKDLKEHIAKDFGYHELKVLYKNKLYDNDAAEMLSNFDIIIDEVEDIILRHNEAIKVAISKVINTR